MRVYSTTLNRYIVVYSYILSLYDTGTEAEENKTAMLDEINCILSSSVPAS